MVMHVREALRVQLHRNDIHKVNILVLLHFCDSLESFGMATSIGNSFLRSLIRKVISDLLYERQWSMISVKYHTNLKCSFSLILSGE